MKICTVCDRINVSPIKHWTLLLSLCACAAAAKRDKRGEFYVQQPQFIPNNPTQTTFGHSNHLYTPIYESSTPRPFSPVYPQPTPTPITPGVTYVTPSSVYDSNNFLSITESTRPKYVLGGGQYNVDNAVQYVTPSTPVYAPAAALNTAAYATPVVHNQYSYLGSQGASDYSIYNYAPGYYNYQYDVKAPEYGVDFGQYEVQEGDTRRGRYYVLLPDGRRQIVDYVADSTGYHPKITYEYVGSVFDQGFGVHYK